MFPVALLTLEYTDIPLEPSPDLRSRFSVITTSANLTSAIDGPVVMSVPQVAV